jgi:DNA-binding NarL/FixJ family response regulator
MLRRGHSTASIAERLEISPVTVRRHISDLVYKLGVGDRSELLDEVGIEHTAPVLDGD